MYTCCLFKIQKELIRVKKIYASIDIGTYDDFIIDILQNRWNSMMQRCYNVNDKKYPEYGGLGVTVCDRWKIVDNYISDMMLVENFIYFYKYRKLF